ncbi:hypothetical protein ACHAWF_014215 [Thalassiosira exigua]
MITPVILCFIIALQASCFAFSPQSPHRANPKRAARRFPDSIPQWSLSSTSGGDDGGADSPFAFLQNPFSKAAKKAEPQLSDVVIDSDYQVAAAFAIVGVSIAASNNGVGALVGGGFITLLASLFAVQATNLRFVFDSECFELKYATSTGSEELEDSDENVFVGGANRWAYASFVNWDFYPSFEFPILVYFKETQTRSEGQIHFFPAVANVRQLKEQFELRGCARMGKD